MTSSPVFANSSQGHPLTDPTAGISLPFPPPPRRYLDIPFSPGLFHSLGICVHFLPLVAGILLTDLSG